MFPVIQFSDKYYIRQTQSRMGRIAIIDLGTNTFHLMIAEIVDGVLKVLHKEKQSVKIGENGISHQIIDEPARIRALNTLRSFKNKMDEGGVDQVIATATSAFRNASNGVELADTILSETGIKIDIIDGKREAELIYKGVRQALDLTKSNALIMDIGGGSVEFIIGNEEGISWMQSFEIGAQRLMDKFHHHDPIEPAEVQSVNKYLSEVLAPLEEAVSKYQPELLIGASGTFDTLSNIYCLRNGIDKEERSELPLTIEGFKVLHGEILSKNRAERLQIPGMIEMRVDMIVVADCLINYVLERFPINDIQVSSYALKEGQLFEICHRMGSRWNKR